MDELKEFFISLEFKNVVIVLASGNVLIKSEKDKQTLQKELSKKLSEHYSYEIDVFLKTKEEIKDILSNNPFEVKKGYYNQVFLCESNSEKRLFHEFSKVNLLNEEEFLIRNDVLYWKFLRLTRLSSNILKLTTRESLKHIFTLRTIGTLQRVYKDFENLENNQILN